MSTRPIRTFTDLLPVLNRGRFVEKCNEHLTHALEHLEALPDEKGVATITLTLTVAYQEGDRGEARDQEQAARGEGIRWYAILGRRWRLLRPAPQPSRHVQRSPRGLGVRARCRLGLITTPQLREWEKDHGRHTHGRQQRI